jgi:glycerophosphoryl diester phosphodiesterase
MAAKAGADMVELDVRTTKDGHFVMMHDATIDATTNGSGNVADYTLEELRSFSMERGGKVYLENGEPVRVPTLAEALNACKGKVYVNLDLKAVASRAYLIKVIQDTGMQGQVMLYCSGSSAKDYQSKDPSIAVHPHIGSASDIDQYASCPGAKLFQYNYSLWVERTSIAKDIRAKGCLSYSNLLNYDAQTIAGNYVYIDAFIDSETDFFQTDCCEFVAGYLRNKGLR